MDPDRSRIYLARHGEVMNHAARVYNGQQDVDITALGVAQMERLRDLLQDKKIAAVYSSDLVRTRRGGEIIARPHGLTPVPLPDFREVHFGRWQGLGFAQVTARYPEDIPQWFRDLENFRIPGGESLADVRHRSLPKLYELIERHRGEEFVLVCHGALNRVFLAEALHLPLAQLLRIEQDYGCLNILEFTPSWSLVKLVNG